MKNLLAVTILKSERGTYTSHVNINLKLYSLRSELDLIIKHLNEIHEPCGVGIAEVLLIENSEVFATYSNGYWFNADGNYLVFN